MVGREICHVCTWPRISQTQPQAKAATSLRVKVQTVWPVGNQLDRARTLNRGGRAECGKGGGHRVSVGLVRGVGLLGRTRQPHDVVGVAVVEGRHQRAVKSVDANLHLLLQAPELLGR
jgi:hypothetical protein